MTAPAHKQVNPMLAPGQIVNPVSSNFDMVDDMGRYASPLSVALDNMTRRGNPASWDGFNGTHAKDIPVERRVTWAKESLDERVQRLEQLLRDNSVAF